MIEELKCCPMCGSDDAMRIGRGSDEWCNDDGPYPHSDFYQVVCSVHEGGCGASGGYKDSEQGARSAWNRRTASAPDVVDEKAEFEKYAVDNGYSLEMNYLGPSVIPSYRESDTRRQWHAWQARAALSRGKT